jgi:hypothetical protein
MCYVLTADQEDLKGTESASLSTAVMLSHILAVDLDRDLAADYEDPEELFMGLFPRWTVRASIDPSDPHYQDGDDDGEDCEPWR